MTEQSVEQRFQQLKKQIKPEQFDSVEWLMAKAEQIEADDAALAKRILVRVANLKKHQANKKSQIVTSVTSPGVVKPSVAQQSESAAKKIEVVEQEKPLTHWPKVLKHSYFFWLVVIPTIAFAGYQLLWATERYESQAQVIVQQPDGLATMDASMAILSGLGVSNTGVSDTELVKAYILSNDMLTYLDKTLNLRAHYSQSGIDLFSRTDEDDSWEELLEFYQQHINVYIDSKSSIVHVYSQAFDAEFAHKLTQTIVDRAEWYINSIGHQLAEAQLAFIRQEHQNIESKLEQAQVKLLNFQRRHNLLDPTAEGMAVQQITYGLEGQISAKEAELKGLAAVMSAKAPQVLHTQNQLNALKSQLEKERGKLSDDSAKVMPLSEILANYTDLKVKMELALQAYTSSQISLEKSRIEAYRQLKYLVVVESATQPEESKYPDSSYNISLFAALAAMLFVIIKIIFSTIRELK
ncbi:lipopolysaccharide biosynthesis protein [Vibrio japonicus]|uniref:Lipopolysaccharide biosynthesis protein n=1 Tax=Vibrio japonicus TaxID=1824638 RepID=A0ABY5LJU6_9VIBR|nr:lipopolysaccharide biosynthesis protein [Vibrio japonicus]UUM30035.1 lipopolysaccharide biosynthesis protein [Vibrio japonicus]